MSEAIRALVDDHEALDGVLRGLQAALRDGEIQQSHAQLDLFWARLAMHIRAEHLHLFPALLKEVGSTKRVAAPSSAEVESAIEHLRSDHEFFMRELASAMATMRKLSPDDKDTFSRAMQSVSDTVTAVERRLVSHNEDEENRVYLWAESLLDEPHRTALGLRMQAELANLPPRLARTD